MPPENAPHIELEALLPTLIDLSGVILFDKTHILHQHCILLYITIVEYSQSICNLTKVESIHCIPIIFRSLIEASLDLLNLLEDPNYGKSLDLNYILSDKKSLGIIFRGENPYLAELQEEEQTRILFNSYKERIKQYEKEGVQVLKIKDKFQLQGMLHEYEAIYKDLNNHTHNNIDALRHKHTVNSKDDFSITFFRKSKVEEYYYVFISTAVLILKCSVSLHKKFKSPEIKQIEKIETDWHEYLRAFNENIANKTS